MIKKMIVSMFFICLVIAIPLAMLGIKHVDLGPSFIKFLSQTSLDMEKWQLQIPNIPDIPKPPSLGGWLDILSVIIDFFNFLIDLFNVIIGMFNFVLMFTQYIFTLVKNLIMFKDTLARIGVA